MIRLTIIIPHYNSVETLKKLLDTIPMEREIEVLVVDDNSNIDTDALSTLEQIYGLSVLKNNRNKKGAGTCRNIGLEHAKGEWILFADADDFFVDDFYSVLDRYFETDYDVVFFTPTSIEVDTGNISDRHAKYAFLINNYQNNPITQSELRLRYEFFSPCSKLIHRRFLSDNNIGFDEVIASNDVMFSTRVGHLMKKFDVSKDIIYCITRSRGSLTVNLSEQVFDARLTIYIKYIDFLKLSLKKEEIDTLHITAPFSYIVKTFSSGMGLKKAIQTFLLFRKSRIDVFHMKHLKYINPINILNIFRNISKQHRRNNRYYIKD